ncbi:hypothetical protein [Alkalihalobacillus sp. CinArs1]|uniref:hypothetical protein n=1 Tax=Alkalihalobacillus sp. CinArs1 TaxID=2995314 RepID=UPI0022DDBBF6|nr:hypothetical protein [Alkalihalobacillus sp. CinArs1]
MSDIALGAPFPGFWTYVLFVVSAGVLGGLGNILLSGEFRLWRKVKSEGQGVYYSIGSLKEPLIGGIGALLMTLMFFETYKNVENLLYISILTGFGSSAFLKRYIDSKINAIQEQSTALLQTENLQYYDEEVKNTGDTAVKGVMTTNGPLPVYLTKDEMQRLMDLQSRVGDAISHKEAKVCQFEMKALINKGKQRAF